MAKVPARSELWYSPTYLLSLASGIGVGEEMNMEQDGKESEGPICKRDFAEACVFPSHVLEL